MSKMFLTSLRIFGGAHKDTDVYIGVFSDNSPSEADLRFLSKRGAIVDVVSDYSELTSDDSNEGLVIGRHLACHYYGHKLLGQYDELIYIDVDVLILNEPRFPQAIRPGILTDIISLDYLEWERFYAKYDEVGQAISKDLGEKVQYQNYYSQWMGNVNKLNLHFYDLLIQKMYLCTSLHSNENNRWGTSMMNWLLEETGTEIIPISEYSGVMPYRDAWDSDSAIIHYDSLNDQGYLYQLFNLDEKSKQEVVKSMLQCYNVSFEDSFHEQIFKIKDKENRDWFLSRPFK